jgi:Subtilase family
MKFITAAKVGIAVICSSLVTQQCVVCGGADDHVISSEQQQQQQRLRHRKAAVVQQPLPSPPTLLPPPRDIRLNATTTSAATAAAAAAATASSMDDNLHVFGPVVFDTYHDPHDDGQQRRRLAEPGGYLILFDKSITNVERHAKRLAKELRKEAKEIMTATIHAVYMSNLTDNDIEYIRAYPGVSEIDPNYLVHMFGPDNRNRHRAVVATTSSNDGNMFTVAAAAATSTTSSKARGQSVNDDDDDDDDDEYGDDDSSSSPDSDGDNTIVRAKNAKQQQLTESQKQRQRRKNQMARPDKSSNLQPVPWNIKRVGGPHKYRGKAKVFIIDTGIDLENNDLNVNLHFAKNFINPGESAQDDHGHGTYCAGIIGALDNKIGVVGVRPGVKVVPLKALDSEGSGGYAGIIAAVEWVARHGKKGDVVNMSLGGAYYQPLDDAVRAVRIH